MLNKGAKAVVEFCLDHAPEAPVAKQISLYRGLAEICGNPDQAAQFCELADDLEDADHRCREFAFKFKNGGRP